MNQKSCLKLSASLVIAVGILVGGIYPARASIWTGASSMSWGDFNNWNPLQVPGPTDFVTFTNQGSVSQMGVVNNIVERNTTITNLSYQAKVSSVAQVNNYHTTQINPGVTLTINRTNAGHLINVGDFDPLSHDNKYFYTVTGSGGSLVAGNVTSPATNQGVQVTATFRTTHEHIGSLDMSGLDSFTLGGGYFWVGVNFDNTIPTDRPVGKVSLARTNLIVLSGNTTDLTNGTFRVGESRGNTPNLVSQLELGQQNTFYTEWLKIGGARSGNSPISGGLMNFRTGLNQPTLKLRGADGISRVGTMRIGDNSWSTGGSVSSKGTVDLTGGSVDALVDTAFVGYGPGGTATTGAALGTLTWTEGIFDINTLFVGYQFGNNPTINTGTVNVQGPNAKLIADKIVLGRDSGNAAGGGVGLLNIDGGTVEVLTYLLENVVLGNTVTSTINLTNNGILNLQPPGDTTSAAAVVDTLNFSSGSVSNGTLGVANINVSAPATAFTVNAGTSLNPGILAAPGILNVNGGLTLNSGALSLDVANTATLDQIAVSGDLTLSGVNAVEIIPLNLIAAGIYPLMSYGSLTGTDANLQVTGALADSRYVTTFDTTAPQVSLNISGSTANLSWSGGNSGNIWNLKTITNWNTGTEAFYTHDAVDFGDAGDATSPINLVGTLLPSSVNFSASSKDYTFAGEGKISGSAGLTLNSGSIPTILTTNDFTGGTLINSGTLALGDGTTAQGSVAGPISNFSTLVFNPAGTHTNANIISGSGSVVKRGTGTTRLTGANTFTGPITIEAGTLQTGSATALGDASISGGMATVQSGATLDINSALGTKPITASGAGVNGAGAIINTGGSQFLRDVQLAGETSIGGTAGITIASSSAASTDPGLTAFGHKLNKVGVNHLKIECLRATPWNLGLGDVDVQGGILSFYGNLNLGSEPTKPITVRSNAVLIFAHAAAFPLTKAISLDNGSCLLGLGAASAVDGSMTLNGRVIFDIVNAMSLTVNSAITGSGPLVKGIGVHPAIGASTGNGNLIPSAANSFTGDLRIETGKVTLTNAGSINSAANILLAGGTLDVFGKPGSTLTLAANQSLKGRGSFIGTLISPSGTTVSPGESVGVINVTGSATLGGTTIMELSKTGTTLTNDQLNATGTIALGGTLNVFFTGDALAAGDKFTLFTASTRTGEFVTVNMPAIPNVVWTNKTSIDGTIEVLSVAPPAAPEIGAYGILPGGNFQLEFSGVNGTGYSVRSSTNVATPINQWTVLSSGTFGANPVQFQDVDATNHVQRFYMITTP